MALLEYNLYLIRAMNDGSILASIRDRDILDVKDGAEAMSISRRVPCVYRESENILDPRFPLEVLTLAFETKSFEGVLAGDAKRFFSWFWHFVSSVKVRFAFIGGGSYAEYYRVAKTNGYEVFSRLGISIDMGEVDVLHPFMFFPADFGDIGFQARIRHAPFFQRIDRKELGCILALAEGDITSNKFELMDPGLLYSDILNAFNQV